MSMKNLTSRIVWLMIVLLLATTSLLAQSGRGWMKGMVFGDSDASGMSGAHVELIRDLGSPKANIRSTKLSTNTNEGNYSFKDIPYGDYTFRVSATGFITYEIKLFIVSDGLTELYVKLKRKKKVVTRRASNIVSYPQS